MLTARLSPLSRYRRVLKKERLKQHLKEFEQLKICDPEAALAKLREVEKQRVEERMSQRHKNTGKWARLQAIKRKYDPAVSEYGDGCGVLLMVAGLNCAVLWGCVLHVS